MEYILIGVIAYAALVGIVWSLCKVASDADDRAEEIWARIEAEKEKEK